jgi:RNA polymerase sigma-70 factor, ECF subfamily
MALTNPDTFLITELKAGNPRAFEKVFRDHYANLTRYSNAIIHDQDKAQSLVQNVFLRLWENRLQLETIHNLPAYLTSMVRNEAINYLKREKRQVRFSDIPEEAGMEQTTELVQKHNELLGQLINALNVLPERCREAFELSRFEDHPNRVIAEKMGISVKGVEALLTRSMKLLRAELAEYLPSARDKKLPGNLLFILFRKIRTATANFR